MHPFLFALLLAAVPLAAGQLEPRRFQGQRHLHQATPYGPPGAQGRLPTFAHAGGPPDVTGVFYADNYIGFVSHGGFVSTVLFPDSNFQSQMGRYTTWECTDQPGGYIATSHRVDTYSNGTVDYQKRCEVGRIDLEKGVWYWNSQIDGCPDPADVVNQVFPSNESTALPAAKKLFCTGDNPGSGFSNTGPLGLDLKQNKYQLGTTVNGPPLPPPLEGGPPPPVYKNAGGSPDAVGIWFSDEKTTGEVKTLEGFSSIQLIPGGFMDVLGRWNTYECGDAPGAYKASISYTQIKQDMTKNSGDTCTDGVVDLASNEYTWQPGEGRGCPGPSTPEYPVKRVTDSKVIPTPTKLTCT
jgi:hypothetical protein